MNVQNSTVEKYAPAIESLGYSPVSSRIYIYILHKGDLGATFSELLNFFNYSKSAISIGLNSLIKYDAIAECRDDGARKRSFYCNYDKLTNQVAITKRLQDLCDLYDGIAIARGIDDEHNRKLKNISLLHRMFVIEFPIIIHRWEKLIN